jgi:S-adenosyl-L-methionine hydrolase (adenosine-forming)
MRRAPLVTLTTDIGWAYAAQIKAAIARSDPALIVVDVAHDVRPQGIREAAFLLSHIAPQFPAGSVHVAVVDPGVGTTRAPLAIRCRDGSFLVGPDNGVLSLAVKAFGGGEAVRLDTARLAPGGRASPTFEGRDVFGPAAAALASGRSIDRLGRPTRWQTLRLPVPDRAADRTVGEVLYIDIFGNLVTNLRPSDLPPGIGPVHVRIGSGRRNPLRVARTYGELPSAGLGLIGSSFGVLELAERDGSAAHRLGVSPGDRVEISWETRAGKGGK